MVLPRRAASARNSRCNSARVTGSSAPNGSSISRMGGSAASARATPTRWRCPPESSRGRRSANSAGVKPTSASISSHALANARFRPAFQARHQRDVSLHGPVREQASVLNDVADAAAQPNGVPLRIAAALDQDFARGGSSRRLMSLSDSGFAGAAAAQQNERFAARNVRFKPEISGAPEGSGRTLRGIRRHIRLDSVTCEVTRQMPPSLICQLVRPYGKACIDFQARCI